MVCNFAKFLGFVIWYEICHIASSMIRKGVPCRQVVEEVSALYAQKSVERGSDRSVGLKDYSLREVTVVVDFAKERRIMGLPGFEPGIFAV